MNKQKNFLFISMWMFLQSSFAQEFNADQVIKDIQSGQLRSVEDILDRIPEDMRENYALIYETRNKTQFASIEEPRIILFSSDGKTQLTFTGNPEAKGGKKLELIQLNKEGAYDFFEFSFPFDRSRKIKNPNSCKACHGNPPRPIWDDYPKWRGAYGSNHDLLKDERFNRGNDNYDPDNKKQKHNNRVKESPGEYQNLENFKQNNAKKMRYKYLKGVQEITYTDLANKNSYLNKTLAYHFWDQLAEKIISSPASKKYLEALYHSFRKSDDFELYLHLMKDKAMMKEIENEVARLNNFKGDDFAKINKSLERNNTKWPFSVVSRMEDRQGFTHIQAVINIIYDKQGKPKPFENNLAGTSYYSFGDDGDNRLSKLYNALQNHAYDIFGKHEYRHLTETQDLEWKEKVNNFEKKRVSSYIPPDPNGSHLNIQYDNLVKIITGLKENRVAVSSLNEKESYLLQSYIDQEILDYRISAKNEKAVKNYLNLLELVAGEKNLYQMNILADFGHHRAALNFDYSYKSYIKFHSADYINESNHQKINETLAEIKKQYPDLYNGWVNKIVLEQDISKYNHISQEILSSQRKFLFRQLNEEKLNLNQKKKLLQNFLIVSEQANFSGKPVLYHRFSKDLHQIFNYLETNIDEKWVTEFATQNKNLITKLLPKVTLSSSSKIRNLLEISSDVKSYSTARYLSTLINLCLNPDSI